MEYMTIFKFNYKRMFLKMYRDSTRVLLCALLPPSWQEGHVLAQQRNKAVLWEAIRCVQGDVCRSTASLCRIWRQHIRL